MAVSISYSASASSGDDLGMVLAIFGGVLFLFGLLIAFGARHAAREQASIQKVGCGQTVPGRVWRVIGTVRAPQPVTAPIAGIACAHWRVEVFRYVGSGDDRHYERVGKLEEAADWWLEDETGRIAVDADGAELTWKGLGKSYGSLLSPNDAPVFPELLRRMGLDEHESYDFWEQFVPLDQQLLAQGKVEQFPRQAYLTGGRDLVLDLKLREDRLGPAKGTALVGVVMAVMGTAMLVGALLSPSKAEPVVQAPPPPGWNVPVQRPGGNQPQEQPQPIPEFQERP